MRILESLIAWVLVFHVVTVHADETARLDDKIVQQVEAVVQKAEKNPTAGPITREDVNALFRASVLEYGNVERLLSWLRDERGQHKNTREQVLAEIEIHVASKRGDLQRASDVLAKLLKQESVADARIDLRLWQAKLFDALGQVEDARKLYQELTSEELSDADQQLVGLRLALMGLLSGTDGKPGADAKQLIKLAKSSDDVALRNRAAIVLAVQNQFVEAVRLFEIVGEGTIRFRNASRVTEWAIRANNRDKTIEFAWDAVRSAQLKRDRRYALALLVESYRLKDGKKGLEALIKAFAKEDEGDVSISNEMRSVWVDLLRELGRHEDAIALFKATAKDGSGFTVEMRRELLEMEGAAGNVDRMIELYRELIASQPDELTWRGGLTRVLLEQGRDEDAAQLWDGYIAQSERGTLLLLAAKTLADLGLDALAERAVERMVKLRTDAGQALLFLADLQRIRGRLADADKTLDRLNKLSDMPDAVRAELASAFERVGRHDRAIEVMEAIRASRETVAEDLEMRLAWLYSEVGDEEKALEQWLTLWRKLNSIPRRRYAEDRLMTVASRLGTLADIAVDLEEKLADGKADEREAGLLVRIYTRVNDSVAASEILEEYMTQSGRNEVERLQEKGRIYQVCNDYWNYEKVIERLIEIDPEGKTDYLRQLALSMLERGKAQDARAVLMKLRDADDGGDSIGGEFEAGVLALVGMNRGAADAYRRGIATYPDRIESYLLLANLLKDMGETDRAVGMFQYLAENADQDDLFTIAIDGLLNMEAPSRVMQWARRITLERLAGRDDKNYLYQLLADLSAEVNDKAGQIRAMESSLAVSGTRRLSVLRECMDLSSNIRGGVFYSQSSRGPSNAGNKPFFAFGRRLIGLGELMPPQVFLDLGQAFLADGDTSSAERTFGLARNLADERGYQREVAQIFEKAGKRAEALVRYDRLLRTSPSDVALIARVAKLNEQEGKDEIACRFYQRGLNLLLAQTPLTTGEDSSKNQQMRFWGGNRDAYQTYSDRLLKGLLVTAPDERINDLLAEQRALIDDSLKTLGAVAADRGANTLADAPRIDKQASALRRLYFAFDRSSAAEELDLQLIRGFEEDQDLLVKLAKEHVAHNSYGSVERMLTELKPSDEQRRQVLAVLGKSPTTDQVGQSLSPAEMWRRVLPLWMSGDTEEARRVLRRVDRKKGATNQGLGYVSYIVVNGMVVAQQMSSATDVSAWARLAIHLNDEGLALTFARSQLQHRARYSARNVKQLFESYRSILSAESFQALVRFAANLYRDDNTRVVEYLWLVSNYGEEVGDDRPADEDLLKLIEDGDLRLSYQFPFAQAIETFPASIRDQALEILIDRIDKKSRPRELISVPFQTEEPLGDELSKIILKGIESGIQPALQDKYLRYMSYYLVGNSSRRARGVKAVANEANADTAIGALDLLSGKDVQNQNPQIADMAKMVKAVVLHQSGRTDDALEIVLESYQPDRQITDYYQRYAFEWAQRELVPVAVDRFLAKLESTSSTPGSTQQTDRKLSLVRMAENDDLLRQAYEQAWKDHPTNSSYPQQYERWEYAAGRINNAIAINERLLEQKQAKKDASTEAEIRSIQQRLGQLWFEAGHPVNGLSFWKIGDDLDIANFEKEQKAAAAAANKPAPASRPQTPTRTSSSTPSVAELKRAVEADDEAKSRQILRHLWRAFPQVVESPYGYRSRQQSFNSLRWPSEPKTQTVKKTSEEDRRRQQRGGLATLDLEPTKTTTTKPESLWKVVAAKPFGVAEMNRILRSRSKFDRGSVDEIVLGLLHADRMARGDDVVFDELVGRVREGHVDDASWTQLFAMIEEDPSRIHSANQSVLDKLVLDMDLSHLKRASQLAWICGKTGQLERSQSLFVHCALLAPSQGVTFSELIKKAREIFEGDDLIELAERMFAVADEDETSVATMLDLRIELLNAKQAAENSAELFDALESNPTSISTQRAWRGVRIFAAAGDVQRARDCLRVGLLASAQPAQNMTRYYPGMRPPGRLSRGDILKMFPADGTPFEDHAVWLESAANEVMDTANKHGLDLNHFIELLLIITARQAGVGAANAATTLSKIFGDDVTDQVIEKVKGHEALAIDVLRLAELHELAAALQHALYQRGQLAHVRYGDLLRDTVKAKGIPAAESLLDELLSKSQDEDLLAAAVELAPADSPLSKRLAELRQQRQAAKDEYEQRTEAARERNQKRQEARDAAKRT